MIVYMDIVVIENLIINYFLILITTQVMGTKVRTINMLLSSFLGALYTLLMFSSKFHMFTNLFGKLLVAIIMVAITLRTRKIATILKGSLIFIVNSFTFVGICFFFALVQNEYNLTKSFTISKYSSKYILFSILIIYIMLNRIIFYIKSRITLSNLIYDIELNIENKIIKIKGFLDTGNELVEPVTLLPVIIAEKKCFSSINFDNKQMFNIPYKVVNGHSNVMQGFKVKNIKIYDTNSNILIKDAIVCFCDKNISSNGDYEALLPRGII